jgi:hypothetical protein
MAVTRQLRDSSQDAASLKKRNSAKVQWLPIQISQRCENFCLFAVAGSLGASIGQCI